MEAVYLIYGSSIGDGYIPDKPGLSGTQNIGQTCTQHTAFADKTNSLFGNTNEIFDVPTSGRSLESLLGYARPTSIYLFLPSLAKLEKRARVISSPHGSDLPMTHMHSLTSQSAMPPTTIGSPLNTQLLDKGTEQGGPASSQEKIVAVQAAGGIITVATASFITTPLDTIKT
ncbi:hypothetical protein T459_08825 [Capsicum annuum]|uniref:Uncharacterized protein n=1 Tax=Capsicum annuum TaxID=4072 RepID=A0A2G2ZXM4_CAPAN|nr:hypothetical protein T459_08825 [Capsicum annuum]